MYLNGESYNDIDESWIDCLKFLKDIIQEPINIQLDNRKYEDFPDKLDEENVSNNSKTDGIFLHNKK